MTLDLTKINVAGFNTSAEAFEQSKWLNKRLGLAHFYQIARLAISRSMGEPDLPPSAPDARGNTIRGHQLFGDEQDGNALWIALIVQSWRDLAKKESMALEEFQDLVRGHWHRGVQLLMEDWNEAEEDYNRFVDILVTRRAVLGEEGVDEDEVEEGATEPVEPPKDRSADLVKALRDLGIVVEIRGHKHGPRISIYRAYLSDVNHLGKLQQKTEELGLALNVKSVTVSQGDEAKIVTINIPRSRDSWETIPGSAVRTWIEQHGKKYSLPLALGLTVEGEPYVFDLASAPHLLVAGTTNSGKSISLHAAILSLLYRCGAEGVRFLMIDPKRVEFSAYGGLPNIIAGRVLNEPAEANDALAEILHEMDQRNRRFADIGVQNIADAREKGEKLPYIVVMVEELADLVLQSQQVEDSLVRIAQVGRSAGIHLILATQRPDAKTFSGLLRSNTARVALSVQKATESRIILDDTGAEKLLGFGDMLIRPMAGAIPVRVHGAYVRRADIVACIRALQG